MNLAAVLFGAYRRQALGLLLTRPDESFHLREIARLAGVSPGSLHRELRLLAAAGLLLRRTSGNQVRYQANREHPIYGELASIFRKTTGIAEVLRNALTPIRRRVDVAFVFGSVARGAERATSDVDLLVIGTAPFAAVVEAVSAARERLGREINPVVMTAKTFRSKAGRDRFVDRVLSEPKLFVTGDKDELGKLVKDRTN
jgi:predicted nucleotidyltransferase